MAIPVKTYKTANVTLFKKNIERKFPQIINKMIQAII